MKKWIKRFFIALGILFLTAVAFVYFSVANRIKIEGDIMPFKNEHSLVRLDSSVMLSDSLIAYTARLMAKANVQGMAISVINNNKVVFQHYFGSGIKAEGKPLGPGTIFYGASFSKTILADIALQLAEENLIHLDSPLYRYLKEPLYTYRTNSLQQLLGANFIDYSDFENDNRYKKITARMCLSHTTGLPNWRWLESDRKLKIKNDPGTRYGYSGEGMFLLQFVMEELTGNDVEEIARTRIFEPLSMNRSSYVWQRGYEGHYAVGHTTAGDNLGIPKNNVPNAAGSLSTTLEDYTHFFLAILKQEQKRHQHLISPQIAIHSKQQFGPNAWVDTNDNDSINLSYGLGFGLYKTPYGKAFFKEGHLEGWQHYAVGFPERGTALVMMSNSDGAESIFKPLIEYAIGNSYTPWFWEGYIPFDMIRE